MGGDVTLGPTSRRSIFPRVFSYLKMSKEDWRRFQRLTVSLIAMATEIVFILSRKRSGNVQKNQKGREGATATTVTAVVIGGNISLKLRFLSTPSLIVLSSWLFNVPCAQLLSVGEHHLLPLLPQKKLMHLMLQFRRPEMKMIWFEKKRRELSLPPMAQR